MTPIDHVIVLLYLTLTVLAGLAAARTAARSADDYFLGGRRFPWWLLGVSGMATFIDLGGTASMAGWFYLTGIDGYWFMFNGHITLMLAFHAVFTAKWLRRSGCASNAEWMIHRFGDGAAGRAARVVTAAFALLIAVCLMPFFWIGAGKTLVEFFPIFGGNAHLAAAVFFAIVAAYTVSSGLYGVVYTDLLQALFILALIMMFAAKAFIAGTPEYFAAHAPAGWLDPAPGIAELPRDYSGVPAAAGLLGKIPVLVPLLGLWLANNLLQGFASPFEAWSAQRYYAARDESEAPRVAALWLALTSLRYLMLPAIAVLALPLAARIDDPEAAMSVVMREHFGPGLRGLVVAGLLAAGMSTVSSFVNACAAYYVRDIHLAWLRPQATPRELTRVSYAASLVIMAAGAALGLQTSGIDAIWGWIMTSVFVGALVPNIVKWFWWRASGWSVVAGCAGGMLAACTASFLPATGALREIGTFVYVLSVSAFATLGATLVTRPPEAATLDAFYRRARPFGFWQPVRARIEPAVVAQARAENRRDLAVLPVFAVGQCALFAIWGCLILKHWSLVGCSAVVILVCTLVLYRHWYLPLCTGSPDPQQRGADHTAAAVRREEEDGLRSAVQGAGGLPH